MTTPTGPPATMAAKESELTPMLSQYLELCAAHDDALVLFQVGDFYEAFCEAADAVARICEVTLTQREDSTGTYPMAGIPIDNASSYLERLVDADYRVAIADQIEDAGEASGLVDRAVTRVITPGTVVDEALLDSGTTNYVASVVESDSGEFGIAAVDVSTGECFVTSVSDRAGLSEELDRIAPAELLVGPDTDRVDPADESAGWSHTTSDAALFDRGAALGCLSRYLADPADHFATDAEIRACGAVLSYAEYTQGDDGTLEYVSRIRRYDQRDHLRLDAAAIHSLELFDNRGLGASETLFDVIDETSSALGRRCLNRWLRRPLVDRDAIETRLDAVETLTEESVTRAQIQELLKDAYDLERLVGRISRGRATPRDLRSLHATVAVVPEIRDQLDGIDALDGYRERLDPLAEVADRIDSAIVDDPPMELTDGGVIRPDFDAELAELRQTESDGRQWVADLEASERERTGIESLSVGHNQVHGYYIEVTNPNLESVPDDYTRRQTLKNAERFYTPELKEREDEIFGAAERADSLEYELFCSLRAEIGAETERIQRLATAIAELDAVCSLSTVAVDGEYIRPDFCDRTNGIDIEGGRHPVVETTEDSFVPNDADLSAGEVAIITGPNMSGKSTYMRQVALTCVLAQIGSFVPAEAAELPILDRIFTRVGASDDIAGGQSTFMREMSELTEILHDGTENSLVLLDEVGRGTSTADGQAIAQATTEFIHDELGAMTLFATHYHGVTNLADERANVSNLHFAATREGDDVTFLHRVAPGASAGSYGIEVARMAGVPQQVVDRARAVVEASDSTASGELAADTRSTTSPETPQPTDSTDERTDREAGGIDTDTPSEQSGTVDDRVSYPDEEREPHGDVDDRVSYPAEEFFGGVGDPAVDEPLDEESMVRVAVALRALDVASMTPLDALNTLDELRSELQ